MGLRGWRLIGVAGTLFVYISGILFLSFVSLQTPHDRHPKNKLFGGDLEPLRSRELGFLAKRPPLKWCRDLTFLDSKSNYHKTSHNQFIEKTKNTFKNLLGVVIVKSNHSSNDKQQSGKIIEDDNNGKHDVGSQKKHKKIWPKTNYNKSIIKHHQSNKSQSSENKSLTPSSQLQQDEKLTALASFPGSGNTWLRYLIQQSTGILTGSVYKDYGLLKSGFPAESIFNSSVLVIKTHEWGTQAERKFQKAILLVRDPAKAIVAEFNRQSGGHVGHASQDRYKRTKGKYWNQFVINKLWAWEQTNLAWGRNFPGPVKIVFYDNLVENVEQTIRELLEFVEFPIDEELLACAMARKEGIYRRKKRLLTFDPYTPAMHRTIDAKRAEVYAMLGRNT